MSWLPLGWTITETIEQLPDPNVGTPAARSFARRTFICTDAGGDYVCSSGSEDDCYTQAQARAEAHWQQRPYDEAYE